MKKNKYIIATLMMFFVSINYISADCNEIKKEFKKVSSKYTVKYEINEDTKDYTLTFYTPLLEKYNYEFKENAKDFKFEKVIDDGLVFSNVKPGEYKFDVIDLERKCNESLKTITLKLPKFNKYKDDPLCKGIEDFVLCSPTYDKEIDYETFKSRIETYKKGKLKEEEHKEENQEIQKEPTFLENVLNYIKLNLLTIIIIIVFVILLTITIIVTAKSIRKSRRLE